MAAGDIRIHPTGFDEFEDHTGTPRLLALTPPKPKAMARLEATFPLIHRSLWPTQGTNRLQTIGNMCPRYDQGQVGCCEPTAETECVGQLRALAGLPKVPLSFSMLYAFINGNQDRGASIGDGYPVLQQFGICKQSTLPTRFLTRGQVTQAALVEARNYRALLAYHCPTFDEIVTAHLLGFAVVNGVCVGGRFNNLDSDGCYPATRGMPNHAVSMWDLKRRSNGEWFLWDCNHWGLNWGVHGDFGTSESAYAALGYQDAIAYQVVSIDADIDLPPGFPG